MLTSFASAKGGGPVRCGLTAQSELPLEYWVARSRRATTAVCVVAMIVVFAVCSAFSTRHPPRKRGIQHAAASRLNRNCLWNTGSPGQAVRRQLCVVVMIVVCAVLSAFSTGHPPRSGGTH